MKETVDSEALWAEFDRLEQEAQLRLVWCSYENGEIDG